MKESLLLLRNYNKASCILGFGLSFAASTPPGPAVSLASPLRLCLAQRSRVHPLELGQRLLRIAADMAVGRVVDDEVELRPVFRRLAHVGHIGEAGQVRKLLLYPWREQALVNTD